MLLTFAQTDLDLYPAAFEIDRQGDDGITVLLCSGSQTKDLTRQQNKTGMDIPSVYVQYTALFVKFSTGQADAPAEQNGDGHPLHKGFFLAKQFCNCLFFV